MTTSTQQTTTKAEQAEAKRAARVLDLRTDVAASLDTIEAALPMLEDLADTRQRGLGFLTPTGRQILNEQIRRERASRYPSTTSSGAPIPVGLRGFVRSPLGAASMPGERPVPANLAAVSLAAEIPMVLLEETRRIRRDLSSAGACPVHRPLEHPAVGDLLEETRHLASLIASPKRLHGLARAVGDLADRAHNLVHGNDRTEHPRPCPHCGRRTLVVYLDSGVIRCEADPHTGRHESCVCPDSYCGCKVRHTRHEWHRDTNASRTTSWQGLNRAQDLAEREAAEQDGATMPDTATPDLETWFTTQWDDTTTLSFVEDENANITGYGHQDKTEFAAQVNAYDALCNGEVYPEAEQWTADHIGHAWALMDPDGERFWVNVPSSDERVEHLLPPGPVTADTPGAFPITTLWGQR